MKRVKIYLTLLLLGSELFLVSGCSFLFSKHEKNIDKMYAYARTSCDIDYNEYAESMKGHLEAHDKDYVMWAMDYASLCLMGGNYDEAKAALDNGNKDIRDREDSKAQKKAAISNESSKVFKGEPFEKAMVCTYLGLISYMEGDYNNARIYFTDADLADATTCDDMKAYRHDFRLAHYWLGRSFMKLGNDDNARIALAKAGERISRKGEDHELNSIRKNQAGVCKQRIAQEKAVFSQATAIETPTVGVADMSAATKIDEMPAILGKTMAGNNADNPFLLCADSFQQFLTLDYQKQVNLILVIETGTAPIKYLVSENGCEDKIIRAPYEERQVMVYLDGHKGGTAFQMIDLFHQADTRGTSQKDAVQVSKGVTKAVLRRMPYIGYAADFWDVRADDRYWHLMPGEVHVFAAKVKPGVYTLHLECFDSNGVILPRYCLTRYYIPVKNARDNVYLLNIKKEADNEYVKCAR